MRDELESRLFLYSAEEVFKLSKNQLLPELNNVIEGFEENFFGIALNDPTSLESYTLTYIGNYEKLEGVSLHTGRFVKNRDTLTLGFSKIIEKRFPEINQLVVFNTFQSKIKELYEAFGIFCISEHILNLQNATLLIPKNKKSADHVVMVDILTVYRSIFERTSLESNIDGDPKVYLMYDRKEDKVKIGETRKQLQIRRKGVAEPTKRAEDPMIEVLTAWRATSKLEDMLHDHFDSKRTRGEWFDLRVSDLQEIDDLTQGYEMVDIRT